MLILSSNIEKFKYGCTALRFCQSFPPRYGEAADKNGTSDDAEFAAQKTSHLNTHNKVMILHKELKLITDIEKNEEVRTKE